MNANDNESDNPWSARSGCHRHRCVTRTFLSPRPAQSSNRRARGSSSRRIYAFRSPRLCGYDADHYLREPCYL